MQNRGITLLITTASITAIACGGSKSVDTVLTGVTSTAVTSGRR